MITIRKTLLGLAASATLLAGIAPASAAVGAGPLHGVATGPVAQDTWDHRGWHDDHDDWRDGYGRDGYDRGYDSYRERDSYRGYDGYRSYDREYRRVEYRGPAWRGNDGRTYCRRSDGTTGLLIGGAAGALIGRGVAGDGDRTLGAILGAAGGALLGRSVDQNSARCR